MNQNSTKLKKIMIVAMLLIFCAFGNQIMGQTWDIGHNPVPGGGYLPNVKATLSGNTLTIFGTGNMADFYHSFGGEVPWWSNPAHLNAIQTVIIQNGVTNIGDIPTQKHHIANPTQENSGKSALSILYNKKYNMRRPYLPLFSCSANARSGQEHRDCSVTQGIYVIICLSLRSNRQSLSRQQGIYFDKNG